MTDSSCWELLGLAPTDNAEEIRAAFAAQSKLHHPEEDPDGFILIREAYKLAMKIAAGESPGYGIRFLKTAQRNEESKTESNTDLESDAKSQNAESQYFERLIKEGEQRQKEESLIIRDAVLYKTSVNRELAQEFILKAKALLKPKYRYKDVKAWQELFSSPNVEALQDDFYFTRLFSNFISENSLANSLYGREMLPESLFGYVFIPFMEKWCLKWRDTIYYNKIIGLITARFPNDYVYGEMRFVHPLKRKIIFLIAVAVIIVFFIVAMTILIKTDDSIFKKKWSYVLSRFIVKTCAVVHKNAVII